MKICSLPVCTLLLFATPAFAANDRIDPTNYICAELIAANTQGEPPLFEALQLDGYAAAQAGSKVADPHSLLSILLDVSVTCSDKPADAVLPLWQTARKNDPFPETSDWIADKTTCAEFSADPDNHSGFIVWLDAYNRAANGKSASVISSQDALDNFIKVCKASPDKLIIDIINETAR